MDWYALQVISGTEADVAQKMAHYGYETILPYVPMFLKQHGKIAMIKRPMLPGYVFVYSTPEALSQIKESDRLKYQQKKIIRVCGNGSAAVPMDDREVSFFRRCAEGMRPLKLQRCCVGGNRYYIEIVEPPPWAAQIDIAWYDADRFKAQIQITDGIQFKSRTFKIAAFDTAYSGFFKEQIQKSLSDAYHGQFEEVSG